LITILVIYSRLYFFFYVQRSLISSSVRRGTQWYLNWGEYSWKINFSLYLNLYKDVLLCWLIRPLLKLITILDEFEDTKGAIRIRISTKRKVQKDKQRSTKHTYKTKDWVTRTPLKTGGEFGCSGSVGSSYSTSDTRRVNLVTNPVISHERGKDREVLTTSGTYPWSFSNCFVCTLFQR
jgi:hypothetical protein